MIHICPFCGRNISKVIISGITTCNNCQRVFDSSSMNKMLSAAWYIIRNNNDNIDFVSDLFKLTDKEKSIVNQYLIEDNYYHDDFYRILKSMDLSES